MTKLKSKLDKFESCYADKSLEEAARRNQLEQLQFEYMRELQSVVDDHSEAIRKLKKRLEKVESSAPQPVSPRPLGAMRELSDEEKKKIQALVEANRVTTVRNPGS